MTPDEIRDLAAKVQALPARINAAHTEENLVRLRREFEMRGWKLTGALRSKAAFALRAPGGSQANGMTLCDAESVLAKIAAK